MEIYRQTEGYSKENTSVRSGFLFSLLIPGTRKKILKKRKKNKGENETVAFRPRPTKTVFSRIVKIKGEKRKTSCSYL